MAIVNLTVLKQCGNFRVEDMAGCLNTQNRIDIVNVCACHTSGIYRRMVHHLQEIASIRIQNILLGCLILPRLLHVSQALRALSERGGLDTRQATDNHGIQKLVLKLLIG